MIRTLIALAAATAIFAPKPPVVVSACAEPRPVIVTVIETDPVVYADPANNEDQPGRVIRADGKAVYTFNDYGEVPVECEAEYFPPVVEDPSIFADSPPVEPGYDEHDPVGPTDDGAPGAGTVDKPAP